MAARKTPYGFIIINGSVGIDAEEAEIVKRIFRDRISGLSGMKIGAALYNEKIEPFTESDKQAADRVYVILNDKRYCGGDGYPPIISEETFTEAKGCMNKKVFGKKQDTFSVLKKLSFCTECGRNMVHFSDQSKEVRWRCTKKGCINSKPRITDIDYTQGVAEILNMVIDDPDMLDTGEPLTEYVPNDRVSELESELKLLFEAVPIDHERVKAKLFELTSARYECCTYDRAPYITKDLKSIVGEYSPSEEINKDMLSRTVERITFDKDRTISVMFKNGKVIASD